MRYFNIPDVTFTNYFGKSVKIKDVLPKPKQATTSVIYPLVQGDMLDDIAVRQHGEDHEMDSYDLFAENMEEITQCDFDLSRLKRIRIPNDTTI